MIGVGTKKTDKNNDSVISNDIIEKLKEACKKKSIDVNELILSFLEDDKRKDPNEKKSTTKNESSRKNDPQIDITADFSKLLLHNNPEIIELLRRMTQSIENIEREHAQGWSDQRIDLQALSKKLDKLM